METTTYTNKDGHELKVVEVDTEGKRVRVDYGNGHFHWWDESEYITWKKCGEETKEHHEDAGEKVLDYMTPDETTSGISHNPITEEPKKKKSAAKPKTKKK